MELLLGNIQKLERAEENSPAPLQAEVEFERGLALHQQTQLAQAQEHYQQALKLNPQHFDALHMSGVVAYQLRNFSQALEWIDKAIAINATVAAIYYNRGVVLKDLHRLKEALASYDQAIKLNTEDARAYNNCSIVLKELRLTEAALVSCDHAIALQPDYAEAYNNRGTILKELRRLEDALASFDQAIKLKADSAEIYNNRAQALHDLNRKEEALINYSQALTIKPNFNFLYGNWLCAKRLLCDWSNAAEHTAELINKIKCNEKAASPFTTLMLTDSLVIQRKAANIWIETHYPANGEFPAITKQKTQSKIRVGYFSADFHFHPVSMLLAELLEQHDKNKFEVFAFSFGFDQKNEMRTRISAALDQFVDVRNQSDADVAALARHMNIDIAVDLNGDTIGSRTGIFAYRAAPLQVNYLGYPGTMGADYFDYVIADKTIIPPQSQQHYAEKIVYLPSYQPSDSQRPIADKIFARQELGLPSEGFTFCGLHNTYKITPAIFDSWMRILQAVTGSVLFLYADTKTAEDNLKKEAIARGVDANRLVFAKRIKGSDEYLARYRTFDLFLDAFPYNAQATANDVLWTGLPLLTLAGEAFASRVAASLLTAIGLPELITTTPADYEALAIELATHPDKLNTIKTRLAANKLTTPLFNTTQYAKNIEAAYTQMVERYQSGLPPAHIYIE